NRDGVRKRNEDRDQNAVKRRLQYRIPVTAAQPEQDAESNELSEQEGDDAPAQRRPITPNFHAKRRLIRHRAFHPAAYGIRIDDPVVARPSRSRCAFTASRSGYF